MGSVKGQRAEKKRARGASMRPTSPPLPEPSTSAMMAIAFAGFAAWRRARASLSAG